MKTLSEQVWPVQNYTDKIHTGVKSTILCSPWLSFTLAQIRANVKRGYSWLVVKDERQSQILDKIIQTGVKKLIQQGLVKKVTSAVSVESQWQSAKTVADSGYVNVTSEDDVAQTDEAKKLIARRAIGGRSLWKLNGKAKLGQLHA